MLPPLLLLCTYADDAPELAEEASDQVNPPSMVVAVELPERAGDMVEG